MNVLVLGASSAVGAGTAESFSPGSRMLLTGRDPSRLRRASDRCRAAGAAEVVEMPWDLRRGAGDLREAAVRFRPDLVINAASASSRLRDHQINDEDMEGILSVDLSAPLGLLRALLSEGGGRPFGVVFISSICAAVRNPGREIYGTLKRLHEKTLLRLAASEPALRLLIVRVSKRIPVDGESPETARLGRAVRDGYRGGKRLLYYGPAGRLMVALFHIHPLLYATGSRMSRFLHGRSSTSN
jgi:NADP-dependent 3-hydroxy acid dehydrogenase YdfG